MRNEEVVVARIDVARIKPKKEENEQEVEEGFGRDMVGEGDRLCLGLRPRCVTDGFRVVHTNGLKETIMHHKGTRNRPRIDAEGLGDIAADAKGGNEKEDASDKPEPKQFTTRRQS